MRYLNKIILINSATVRYAEIELNGNVHFTGTQGVGKSTLLRAILFFYNADKRKLGIPKEKKRFDDYYFEYSNSYIIYEIMKNGVPFCVLAYKVNGKVSFRFFDSGYQDKIFLDQKRRAFENWDKIREALGKEIHYTNKISNYEEFKKIIYGDNKGLKDEFKKYALLESEQYQNIPRTIQNVLLNTNLEAQFIKDTIIDSISEEEFKIDLEQYAKSHLRDFESERNDIGKWFKKNRQGAIPIINQANAVIENHRIFNLSEQQKKDLAVELSQRIQYIEKEKPKLTVRLSNKKNKLKEVRKTKEKLEDSYQEKAQKLVSEIEYINKKLKEAEEKQADYESKNIKSLIQKVADEENLTSEKSAKEKEKQLLEFQFTEINQKFDALIKQAENEYEEFKNKQNNRKNSLEKAFMDEKEEIRRKHEGIIKDIKDSQKEDIKKANDEINRIKNKTHSIEKEKASLKHKIFFTEEISKIENAMVELNTTISNSETTITKAKSAIETLKSAGELDQQKITHKIGLEIDKKQKELENFRNQIAKIESKIKQSETSLYGWLNEHVPDWEHSIGKVIDEEHVLFNSALNPELANEKSNTLFGVTLNLNALKSRVKTVKAYRSEIATLQENIKAINIVALNETKNSKLKSVDTKYRKKIKVEEALITTSDYNIDQCKKNLKSNQVGLNKWNAKSKREKKNQLEDLSNQIESLSGEKESAEETLEKIKKEINEEIHNKKREKEQEIKTIKSDKNDNIKTINTSIETRKLEIEKRIKDIEHQKKSKLKDSGADTKRLEEIDPRLTQIKDELNFIKQSKRTVFGYEKDKRELFDKVPQFKAEKKIFENKRNNLKKEHTTEIENIDKKIDAQNKKVVSTESTLKEFKGDLEKYDQFTKSEIFESIKDIGQATNSSITSKTAVCIIEEIKEKHCEKRDKLDKLKGSITRFSGNFKEDNIFNFKVNFTEDTDYLKFAANLKEFIEEDKISEYRDRVNRRFAHIINRIGKDMKSLVSKETEIEKIIQKINKDFSRKNFVKAVKAMEMKKLKSRNPIVQLFIQIKEFNDENHLYLGESNLFNTDGGATENKKAVDLITQLLKETDKYKKDILTLSESFDLEFRIVENDNDSGWVEKISNVGSEGTDVLVKAMINILLLNVFKDSASKKMKDFKLHCMMDEIGRLHPSNVKGILRFANERNILLINGSPTSQDATKYRYTYQLYKEQSTSDKKKYFTRIKRLVKVLD